MTRSQKEAVITLIEKKGKDRSLLENWRPIFLGNVFFFFWKGTDKVERVTVINEYEEGGLRMTDLECMIKSLKLAWLRQIFNEINGPWKSFLQPLLNTKARYIRKNYLGRSRPICQSPLKCAGQIQNGGRFELKKGKL